MTRLNANMGLQPNAARYVPSRRLEVARAVSDALEARGGGGSLDAATPTATANGTETDAAQAVTTDAKVGNPQPDRDDAHAMEHERMMRLRRWQRQYGA